MADEVQSIGMLGDIETKTQSASKDIFSSNLKKIALKSLRTYQGDIEEALAKNKESVSSIVIAEQKRKEVMAPQIAVEEQAIETKKKISFSLSISIIVIGIIALGGAYFIISRDQTVPVQKVSTLISFSSEKKIPIVSPQRVQIVKEINSEKKTSNTANSVTYLNFKNSDDSNFDIKKLLLTIAPKIPASLIRSFGAEYMIGIYAGDTNEPFFLMTTDDYADSYAGMLKWEKSMPVDLGGIFATSESFATTSQFQDEALKNKDLRILRDENRNTILAYSFIDRNTLVITTNEETFSALLGKYLLQKATR